MSCSVCCLDFTNHKRVKITCAYCHYEACQECYRTYISSTVQDAHCMNCRRVWDREVLSNYFPVTWLNGAYKRHREIVLIEREKQLLPESQHLVTNFKLAKRLRLEMNDKSAELQHLKTRVNALQRDIYTAKYRVENLERTGYRGDATDEERAKRQRLEFIAPCPVEDCRGFMNAKMVCGTCAVIACEHCGVVKDSDTHVCDKDIAANFKVIKGQTKACPKCAVPTMKSSGCSQMWCTQCQTTWDWNTGEIQRGVIHNPHYFQYMRERSANGEIPRQPGDGAGPANCDRQRFPRSWDVSEYIQNETREIFGLSRDYNIPDEIRASEAYKERVRLSDELTRMLRKLLHIQEVEIRNLRHREDHARDNADLRLKYLVNDISEEDFRVQLQRREKKRQKDIAVRDIYQMACDTGRDVFWVYMDGSKNLEETMAELNALRSYANTHLRSIRTHYKMQTSLI